MEFIISRKDLKKLKERVNLKDVRKIRVMIDLRSKETCGAVVFVGKYTMLNNPLLKRARN